MRLRGARGGWARPISRDDDVRARDGTVFAEVATPEDVDGASFADALGVTIARLSRGGALALLDALAARRSWSRLKRREPDHRAHAEQNRERDERHARSNVSAARQRRGIEIEARLPHVRVAVCAFVVVIARSRSACDRLAFRADVPGAVCGGSFVSGIADTRRAGASGSGSVPPAS